MNSKDEYGIGNEFVGMKIIGFFFIILFLIIVSVYFYHSFIKSGEEVCHEEFIEERCYLVGCSALGCSRYKVDCESLDVDIRENIYETKCEWIRREE